MRLTLTCRDCQHFTESDEYAGECEALRIPLLAGQMGEAPKSCPHFDGGGALLPLPWPEGVHDDIGAEDYHGANDFAVSSSFLHAFGITPEHGREYLDRGIKDTADLRFGRAAHTYMLESEKFSAQWVERPKFTGTGSKAAREEWKLSNADRGHLDPGSTEHLVGMRAALERRKVAGAILAAEKLVELTLCWRDAATGLPCRARLDAFLEGSRLIVDYKTGRDASPEGFGKSVYTYGYAVQRAHYWSGAVACGLDPQGWLFLVQEKDRPYRCTVPRLGTRTVAMGEKLYRERMSLVAECVRTGEWPGYADEVIEIDAPEWALRRCGV